MQLLHHTTRISSTQWPHVTSSGQHRYRPWPPLHKVLWDRTALGRFPLHSGTQEIHFRHNSERSRLPLGTRYCGGQPEETTASLAALLAPGIGPHVIQIWGTVPITCLWVTLCSIIQGWSCPTAAYGNPNHPKFMISSSSVWYHGLSIQEIRTIDSQAQKKPGEKDTAAASKGIFKITYRSGGALLQSTILTSALACFSFQISLQMLL